MCKDCGCGEDNGVVTKVFTVPGMMCNNCKETVEGASLGLPGVLSEGRFARKDCYCFF